MVDAEGMPVAVVTFLAGCGGQVQLEDVFAAVAGLLAFVQYPLHLLDHTLQTLIHIQPHLVLRRNRREID